MVRTTNSKRLSVVKTDNGLLSEVATLEPSLPGSRLSILTMLLLPGHHPVLSTLFRILLISILIFGLPPLSLVLNAQHVFKTSPSKLKQSSDKLNKAKMLRPTTPSLKSSELLAAKMMNSSFSLLIYLLLAYNTVVELSNVI
jgi:hypothetical protein